jgi:hypothetical protein
MVKQLKIQIPKLKLFQIGNLTLWFYDIGFRKEFRITYFIPTLAEIKHWWRRLKKKHDR